MLSGQCWVLRLVFIAFLIVFAPSSAFSQDQTRATARPELVLQTGHNDSISAISLSSDGRLLASAGHDNAIKIWEVATGLELRTLKGPSQWFESLAFSPDGHTLAAGSYEHTIKLWDVTTGRELRTLRGHADSVDSLAFSPDGHTMASGSRDSTISIWDVESGVALFSWAAHESGSANVAFSPDGRTLASGGGDNRVKLWDVATGREIRALIGHTDWVKSVAFSPDGNALVSGSSDKTVKLWDVTTGRELHTFQGHTDFVSSVAFSPLGHTVVSGSWDNTVRLWDTATGKEIRTLRGHTLLVLCVAFSRDGRALASASADKTIMVWDAASGREHLRLTSHTAPVWSVAFSPDGLQVAVGGKGDSVQMWSLLSGQETRSLTGHNGWVTSVAFSPDGSILATGGDEKTITLWEVASGMQKRTLTADPLMVNSVAFSPNGRILASAGSYVIALWNVATGEELHETHVPMGVEDISVAFSPDGRTLASGGRGYTIKLWDVVTGRNYRTLPGPGQPVFSLAFSPDGHVLATSGSSPEIKLWDAISLRELRNLRGHRAGVNRIAFSPDGKTLASGSEDKTFKLWDTATARELSVPSDYSLDVSTVVFSPDGRTLALGSLDGSTRLWDVAGGRQLASLVGLNNSDWLVVTPDGLFDGSPAAWKQILWRFNNNTLDFVPVEQFFAEYYHPGLLADIMAGKPPKATTDIAQKDRRQPQIQLSAPDVQQATKAETSRNLTVKLAVAEGPADKQHTKGSGVRDLRLFRNGSLVKVWRGDLKLDAQGKATLEATIPLVAGENRLTAYAFNHDNIKSSDATLLVTGADSLKRRGTAYIVAVGINQYANADYNLNFAVADAQDVGEELHTQQAKLGKYSKIELVPLLDNDATKANFLQALERLAGLKTGPLPASAPAALAKLEPAQPEDAVFVYFAGHGAALGPRFYLIPHDLGYAGKRTELDEAGSKLIQEHSISDLELELAFEKVDAGELVLIIDACNSGQALEAEEKRRGPMNSKGLAQLAYEKGMYILTAAQGYQAALEAKQLGHGLLTYALVEEGLKTAAADKDPKDGQVVIREWLNYATERVPQLQEAKMQEAEKTGRELTFLEGEDTRGDRRARGLQRPRVFYRREPESQPPVIARVP